MKKTYLLILLILFVSVQVLTFQKSTDASEGNKMKIKLIFDDAVLTATMKDNPTARDFISLLPLTLTLDDYANTEKVSNLPGKLSLKGAPSGSNPEKGDITLYAPWGNLAIFYKDFGYADGLIILGSIDSNVEYLSRLKGSMKVRIEVNK